MAKKTQITCLHEGSVGHGIDSLFINQLIKSLKPAWIRPWGTSKVRLIGCGGRATLIQQMPDHLKSTITAGGHSTLMVWADVDDTLPDPEALRTAFWQVSEKAGISREHFESVVFVFARDRLENWVEFLNTGHTDEGKEGPRVEFPEAAKAALELARLCESGATTKLPASLQWSCKNWKSLVNRMKQ